MHDEDAPVASVEDDGYSPLGAASVEVEAAPVATVEEENVIETVEAEAPTIAQARLKRGDLESEVKDVTDLFVEGGLDTEGKPLTPYRIVQAIKASRVAHGFEARDPSSGAVTETLKRWRDIGFAEVTEGPWAFVSYTPDAYAFGLIALKEKASAARKAKKAAAAAPVVETVTEPEPATV